MDKRTHITERLAIATRNGELFFEIRLSEGGGVWACSESLDMKQVQAIEQALQDFQRDHPRSFSPP